MSFSRDAKKQEWPIVTMAVIAWCVVVFFVMNSHPKNPEAAFRMIGLLDESEIYRGQLWGLITLAFVHQEPMHLLFNLYWLWILGSIFERRFGPFYYVFFIAASAFISSGIQLFEGSGIGLSGVGYALFGFAWMVRKRVPEFARIANDRTVMIFIGWGIFCVFATYTHLMNIGNLAHASGLAFGVGLGIAQSTTSNRYLGFIGLMLLAGISLVPVYWNPNSEEWVVEKAIRAEKKGDLQEAARWYRRYVEIGFDKKWGWYYLGEVEGRLGNRSALQEALNNLARIAPDAAARLSAEYPEK